MADDLEGVIRAVIAAALAGDMVAAKIIIDRLVPPRRGRPVKIDLPRLKVAKDLPGAVAAVVRAVSTAELTPEEGEAVAAVLNAHCRALELVEIEARVAALEAAHAAKH